MRVVTKCVNYNSIPQEEYQQICRLRYQVFVKRLKWELHTSKQLELQLESDEYDYSNAQYLYVTDNSMQIYGCWRILPTLGRYMLKNTFPTLLEGHSIPASESVYELSRFAVDKHLAQAETNKSSSITMKLFQGIYDYAIENGIKEYVTVTTTAVERILKRIGIPFTRIGDKQVHLLGNTKSIALSIQVNRQFMLAVQDETCS
ncbi:acyl-homoserine-lactone synthase [Pseudoalteromonas luteoviolacea]|uniref:Acyl-homoserine-lactone synthase n=1 Tax=Pseudoalteromonas luteoviolacea S4054 TaxID=1129367 RepID=A0A0F6AD10_9GAMM|nr:acyl-homoserine-lactone synthase [Pseudoalteromonas luteoviolacea]AOT09764.1 acyl-homoserine-lactone synthase [Pseudoalteromonas luteoviolacea]AOT14677.1 acyl-homoserine-lactone synthase [Pseudoalteromonas luteoviolacea]AOT19591.1 acyl-homoserine-lactone synthase [Pseudoalteromonas luteoviolacea]KKE84033.1 hypothetical protein N479_11515 [Pseudoalteromonas luteoviolacea S4054]KZN77427.1 hypothetical protein N481_05055 [Pseudoalteromonas luteoviolacea S4047-1]